MGMGVKAVLCAVLVLCWVWEIAALDKNTCFEPWSGDVPRPRSNPKQCFPRRVDLSGYAQIPEDIVQKYNLKTNFINTSGNVNCYEDHGCNPNPVVWKQAEAHWILLHKEPAVLQQMKEAGVDGVVGAKSVSGDVEVSPSGDDDLSGSAGSEDSDSNLSGLRGAPRDFPAPNAKSVHSPASYAHPPSGIPAGYPPYFMPPYPYPPPPQNQGNNLSEQLVLKFMDYFVNKKLEDDVKSGAAKSNDMSGATTPDAPSEKESSESGKDDAESSAEPETSKNPFDGEVERLTLSTGFGLNVEPTSKGLRLSVTQKVPIAEE